VFLDEILGRGFGEPQSRKYQQGEDATYKVFMIHAYHHRPVALSVNGSVLWKNGSGGCWFIT
jgi:hypothetical protein